MLALITEGNLSPSMQEIGDRAGVSRRLVFHHFKDAASMNRAFMQKQAANLRDLFEPIPESMSLPERLNAIVEQRARIYEKITPTRRAGLIREHDLPEIAQSIAGFRALKRAQIEAIFAPEVRSCAPSLQPQLAAALGCAASFSSWESLRRHQRLTIAQAKRALVLLLGGLLRLTPAGAALLLPEEPLG